MKNLVLKFEEFIYHHLPFGKQTAIDIYRRWVHGIYRLRTIPKKAGVQYVLNDEIGTANIEIKLERVARGGQFEQLDTIATNKAIGLKFLTPDIKTVVNIGSGVGTFEYVNSQSRPEIKFLASEMDAKSTEWVKDNRPFENVRYCADDMTTILKSNPKFDLAVSIDVIEHVADYKSFLDEFVMLADKAVIATPNRDRDFTQIRRASYKYHVQEFNAGEFFFILKMYYRKVVLYSAPDIYKTDLVPVGLYSTYHKLFAYCER